MPGIGAKFLPLPRFSPDNPYWVDPSIRWGWLHPQYRPKLTARHFLYASTWETTRFDPHGAYCVRTAQALTIRVNLRVWLRHDMKEWWIKSKEKKDNEEAA